MVGPAVSKFKPGEKMRVRISPAPSPRKSAPSAAARIIRAHEKLADVRLDEQQFQELERKLLTRLDWATLEEIANWVESPAYRQWNEALLDILREAPETSRGVFPVRSVPEA